MDNLKWKVGKEEMKLLLKKNRGIRAFRIFFERHRGQWDFKEVEKLFRDCKK